LLCSTAPLAILSRLGIACALRLRRIARRKFRQHDGRPLPPKEKDHRAVDPQYYTVRTITEDGLDLL
jgi:hypothetical protein